MKSLNKLLILLFTGGVITGCIDNDYDLSDIDTTARIKVDDLVIPVNLGEIKLGNILDLDPDGNIKEIDGQYVLVQDGSFSSENIVIDPVVISSPSIPQNTMQLNLGTVPSLPGMTLECPIQTVESSFSCLGGNVSSSIVSIENVSTDFTITYTITLPQLENVIRKISIKDLKIKLPKGLTLSGTTGYDAMTGILDVGTVNSKASNSLSFSYTVTGIDYKKSGLLYDPAAHTVSFSDKVSIVSGTLELNTNDIISGQSIPSSLNLVASYDISEINIRSFTGYLKYSVDGVRISDVELNDLPDVLTQEGTDIRIYNPQIYLNIYNPLYAQKDVKAQSGMTIISYGKGGTVYGEYSLDAPGYFSVGASDNGWNAVYLAPHEVKASEMYGAYPGAKYFAFTSLSDVLSGNGLPTRLNIRLDSPEITPSHVIDFNLKGDLGKVEGNYTFYSPLAFGDGSTIYYRDAVDGWNDEDVDNIVIQKLKVSAIATSELPIALDFTGYPVDVNGKQIGNVTIEGAKLEANADGQRLEITVSGEIRHLDGIIFVAKGNAKDSAGNPLTPEMGITLKDIRANVSGYYEKEL